MPCIISSGCNWCRSNKNIYTKMVQRIKGFLLAIYVKRGIIKELTKRNFQQQYMGSYLGFIWVFLQPLIFISVLYAVFTFGLRSGSTSDVPFVVYLICGMIAWMYFAEILNSTTGIISGHAFLVKKVDFRLSILPIVKILSALVPHVFFLFIATIICWLKGFTPSLYIFQVFYYMGAMIFLLLGLSWITSSTSLFVKDVLRVVSIITQFGFWLTPIFWNIKMIPEGYRWIIKLNPIYYIVNGYRDSFVNKIPFWEHPYETIYFWLFTLVVMYVGITIFGKLRPHFAEVV